MHGVTLTGGTRTFTDNMNLEGVVTLNGGNLDLTSRVAYLGGLVRTSGTLTTTGSRSSSPAPPPRP